MPSLTSVIGSAIRCEFTGDLLDVDFVGPIERCSFGNPAGMSIRNVTFGAHSDYQAEGFYRPEQNCIMFTRTEAFCVVCAEAIEKVIDEYTLH